MRSCVFVNSKCKNNINNDVKSDCNNVCITKVDNNTNKHQVGEVLINKSDENRLCGNDSIKVVKHDAEQSSLSHTEVILEPSYVIAWCHCRGSSTTPLRILMRVFPMTRSVMLT